jgi:hypothetical protein
MRDVVFIRGKVEENGEIIKSVVGKYLTRKK